MPSKNPRVNLTLSSEEYLALCDCVEANAFPSCAALVKHILLLELRRCSYLTTTLPFESSRVKGGDEE